MADEIFSFSHPLLPPTTEDDQVTWLRLRRSYHVGLSTFYRLMATYGSAQAALAALPQVAADAGLRNYTAFSEDAARTEMAAGKTPTICTTPSSLRSDFTDVGYN